MSKYTELAAALRRTTQEMAVTCSAPLDVWGRHSNTALEAAALRELEQESERLKELLACAYQLAGTVGAPVRFLDAFSRYEGGIDSLLPVSYDEIEVCAERDRLREAFYFAWSRRPLLGKQWDGESDPLPLVLAAMDEERAALEGEK